MMADHAEISVLFEEVLDAFRCGDRDVAAEMFTRFEARLAAHLAAEDELLLPALERVDPEEAAALAADHRAIRARLTELGIGVDLHLTRASAVAELVEMLRAHARREDALLYRWADEVLSEIDRKAVLARSAAFGSPNRPDASSDA
jgi:hemerythrin-like domain-containing protein